MSRDSLDYSLHVARLATSPSLLCVLNAEQRLRTLL